MNYVHYYPRAPLEVCKSSVARADLASYFTRLSVEEAQPAPGPAVNSNYRAIRWSPRRARELGQFYQAARLAVQCAGPGGVSFPGNWDTIEQGGLMKDQEMEITENEENEVLEQLDVEKKSFFSHSYEEEWSDYDWW